MRSGCHQQAGGVDRKGHRKVLKPLVAGVHFLLRGIAQAFAQVPGLGAVVRRHRPLGPGLIRQMVR
jgi:hypothetical protein